VSLLEKIILKTLAWFDLFQYPLTTWECWQWLYVNGEKIGIISPLLVQVALENLRLLGKVKNYNGYWQLADKESYLAYRLQRSRWAIAKQKRAMAGIKLISFLPFVRLVSLSNTVAWDAPSKDSDIDLFIVAKSGRLYLTRLLVTLLVHWRGWRRHGKYTSNRLCLSFYATDQNLGLQDFAYKPDPYLAYWVASIMPLLDRFVYKNYLSSNDWVNAILPNWHRVIIKNDYYLHRAGNFSKRVQGLLEFVLSGRLGDWTESWAHSWQLPRIKNYLSTQTINGPTDVVINDKVIKMHTNDRRQQLANKFEARLSELL